MGSLFVAAIWGLCVKLIVRGIYVRAFRRLKDLLLQVMPPREERPVKEGAFR